AVQLYSETAVIVESVTKIRTRTRSAYKILRPEGRTHGTVYVPFQITSQKITILRGWCIPAQGKDFEVREKDADEVRALTSSRPSALAKMQAIASFVQHDVRYVAIELGIGGWQPHPAAGVFTHRYGDCKDKATLMRSMLKEIDVDSYYVLINTTRGAVTPNTPAHNGFNHVIVAVKLPDGLSDPSLVSTLQDTRLGRILLFDPTNDLTRLEKSPGTCKPITGC
ncbi:MAG: hypothetical protein QOD84_1871, partial [Acidobacteriaceae bacterium]